MLQKYLQWLLLLLISLGVGCQKHPEHYHKAHIKVGVLHSQTGLYAEGERTIMHATLLAIEEINANGGILGCHIEPVLADGQSSPDIFAREAKRLIEQEKVVAIFGCLTSDCRRAVKTVVEEKNSVLFYPMLYEGLECSPNVIYMGACPNQSVIPAVHWARHHFGKRFMVLGFDSVFSHAINAIIIDHIQAVEGEVVAEAYFNRKNCDYTAVIERLRVERPDVIITTQGKSLSNQFFEAIAQEDEQIQSIPIFTLGMSNLQITPSMEGKYVIWNYYDQLSNEYNKCFTEKYRHRYGVQEKITEPMVIAYSGVYLWSMAVTQAESPEPSRVLASLPNQSVQGPTGLLYISPENYHAYRTVRIGRVLSGGHCEIVWDSKVPLSPDPYPAFRTPKEWDQLISDLVKTFSVSSNH